MLNYQFGKHLKFEDALKDKNYFAKLFSEENPELEKLLLNLWDKNIETYMCCTGHNYGDAAYIMMYLPLDEKETIYNIINSVYNLEGVTTRLGREHNRKKLLIDIKAYNDNSFFRNINKSINKNISKDKVVDDLVNIVELLSKFERKNHDLYCEITNYEVGKKFNVYVNSISQSVDGPIRHMYVLNKYFEKKDLIKMNSFFSDEELEQNYNKQKKLSKKFKL